MASAPTGPLVGDELNRAIEVLTDRQLRAYRYRRNGHALNWIAQRMGISRTAVVHHIAKAEKRFGYEPSVTGKQKTPYKSVAQRRTEVDDGWTVEAARAIRQMTRDARREFIRRAYPGHSMKGLDADSEIRLLARIYVEASSDDDARARIAERLRPLKRSRERERVLLGQNDDLSRAVGEDEAEFVAELEADFGVNSVRGEPMQASDFVADDGKGYDRL